MDGGGNFTVFDRAYAQPYRQVFRMNGWNTPPDYLEYVHPHWLKYEAPNPFMHHMLGVFYLVFMFSALIGNGVVIYIFSSCKSLRTPGNFLVVNLAIFDFIMMVKTPIFISNSFNEGPLYGWLGCQIYGILGSVSGIGASTTNAAIAYDRYSTLMFQREPPCLNRTVMYYNKKVAICILPIVLSLFISSRTIAKPFDGKLSQGKVLMIILFIWLYALPFTIMPAMEIWGRFVPEGYLTSCTFDYMADNPSTKMFVACIFIYSWCIPVSLTAYFYSKIVSHVRDHEKLLREQAKKMNVESLRGNRDLAQQSAEIRIAKVAIGICCLFLLSWTPYAICALIAAFGNREIITPLVSMTPAMTCKAVACLDPWIYAINHPRYRLELQKKMPWFCIHEPEPPAENASTASEKTQNA